MPRYKAAWYGLADETREIVTSGVLLLGPDSVVLRLLPSIKSRQDEFNEQAANLLANTSYWTPELLFEHHVEQANGYSVDISVPFDVTGPSLDYVGDALITELRHRAAFAPDKSL